MKFYPRFDHVILLSAPIEVMLSRLTARTTNPYGKRPDEQTEVRSLKQTVEPALRRAASSEIDTNAPLDAVVAAVLNSVR